MEWVIGLGLLGALLAVGYLVWANVPMFWRLWEGSLQEDFNQCQGHTLVQRFEGHYFYRNGNQVRLILRASSTMPAYIDSIWISQQAPAGNPYDAAADLKQFYGKVQIPANTRLTLSDIQPDVQYHLDQEKPLLIAVDFERGAPSGVRFFTHSSHWEATAYFLPPGAGGGIEAGRQVRSPGYFVNPQSIFLIEGIFVAD